MKKRILSIVLMLAMVFSMAIVPEGAASAAQYYDTEGLNCELAVDVLSSLGIMSGYTDGSFLPYNTITRAEMASVAVKLAGLENIPQVASDEDIQFNDMYGYDGWASGVVAIARAAGIAKGDADGNFNPDVAATYEDAVQMVVCALGYESLANSRGGEPKDFVDVARRLGLLKKLSTGLGQNITRGDVALLVYQALTVDLMEAISYASDGTYVRYAIAEGSNALNTYFDVTEIKGIVTENEYSAILGETTVDEGEILLNGEIFEVGSTDIADALGYYVKAYALEPDDSGDSRIIIAYTVENVKNNTLTIEDEFIESVSMAVTGYTYEYWANDTDKRVRTAATSSTPLVLYNGKSVEDVTRDLLKPEAGHVVLIDNNGDDKYDIIDVWEYDLVFVYSASTTSGSVSNYYNTAKSYKFDPENDNYHVTFLNAGGGRASLSDIKQYSVLYVYQSIDEEEKKVVISNTHVNGSVDEIGEKDTYVIAGVEYKMSPMAKGKVELAISDAGDFYFDADNRIAGFNGTSVIRKNIGAFIAVNNGGLERGYQMKVLTQNNGVQIFDIASTVTVNGRKMSSDQVYQYAYTDLLFGQKTDDANYTNYGTGAPRPHASRAGFLYKVNSMNEITDITVVNEGASGTEMSSGVLQTRKLKTNGYLYYSKNRHVLHYSQEQVVDEYGNNVGKRTYCTDNTPNFCIEEGGANTDDNQNYMVRYMSSYWDNYNFDIYDYVWAYYYSADGEPIDMQKTACNFLVMENWYEPDSSSAADERNVDARDYQDNTPVKFIYKITQAHDSTEKEDTYRVYYFDGTSLRNSLIRPIYKYTAHLEDNDANLLYPNGYPVRISTDGSYIEQIWPFFGSFDTSMTDMVTPIQNESTNTKVMPFVPFYQEQWRRWNRDSSNQYCSQYFLGMVTSVDEVVGLKFFTLAYGSGRIPQTASEIQIHANERLEGTVYQVNYDRDGKMDSISRGTLDDITPGKLVLIRRRGYDVNPNFNALTSYSMNEIIILADSVEELDYLSDFYSLAMERVNR